MPPKTIVRFVAMSTISAQFKSTAAEAQNDARTIAERSEGTEIIVYKVTFLETKKVKAVKSITVEDA